MAIIETASHPASAGRRGQSHSFAGFVAFFSSFFARAFDPYRPELHYMRGPGPACRAKQASALRHAS